MKSHETADKRNWFLWGCAVVFLALCLAHVDVVRGLRDEDWPGFHGRDITGILAATAVYAVLTGLFAGAVELLAGLYRNKRPAIPVGLGVVFGACAAWTVTAYLCPVLSTHYLLLGYAAAVAGGFTLAVLALAGNARLSAILLIAASAVTLVAHIEVATLLIALPNRRIAAHAALLAWLLPLAILLVATAVTRLRWRRSGLTFLFAVWLAAPLAAAPVWTWWAAQTTSSRTNIVLLTAETLRADACELDNPNGQTPALAALGERGVWFSRSYSAAPWTVPSFVAMMSSQYAAALTETTSLDDGPSLPQAIRYASLPDHATLAETLQQAGYHTAAFKANTLLGILRSTTDGFETAHLFDFLAEDRSGLFPHTPVVLHFLRWVGYEPPVPPIDTTARLTLLAKSYMRWQSLSSKPFFLWVHFGDCHAPYTPPPAFCDDPELARQMSRLTRETWPPMPVGERFFEEMTPEKQARLRALYNAEVRYVDAAVDELSRLMDALGLFDSSVFCFTSDHGEEFWEHGCWGHGVTLYEAGIHVPLILTAPDMALRGRQDQLVIGYDLAPTLLGLADCPIPEPWQGRDFSLWLNGGEEPEAAGSGFVQGTLPFAEIPQQRSLIRGFDKIIEWPFEARIELYDLDADPLETHNLAADAETIEPLLQELQQHAAEAPIPPTVEDDAAADQFNEQLRAIGYM